MTHLPRLIVTLLAIVFLGLVVFGVPMGKTIFFLKAAGKDQGVEGSITFGTLGYCVQHSSTNTTCSKLSVGYKIGLYSIPRPTSNLIRFS